MRPAMNRQSVPLKKGEFKKNIGKLVVFMRPYYIPILVSLVFTVGATLLSIFAPQILSDLVDVITASFGGDPVNMTELEKFALILVVFYACNALCTYVSSFIMTTVSQKMSRSLRTQISEKINRVPLRYFDSHPYGDTLSRVTNDVDTIGNSMQQSVSMVVQSACMLIGVLIAMFVSCWQLALTVLIIVPFNSPYSTEKWKRTIRGSSSSRRSMPKSARARTLKRQTVSSKRVPSSRRRSRASCSPP